MNKRERHKEILSLVKGGKIKSQADLFTKLSAKGVSTTQATLSRDINELGIIKEMGVYKAPDIAKNPVQFGSLHSIFPVGECFLMIKTSPGLANALAELIDISNAKGVLGTIAGDNTILVGLARNSSQNQAIKSISSLLNKSTRPRRSRR